MTGDARTPASTEGGTRAAQGTPAPVAGRLQGRRAVVTGAATGIGRALAIGVARAGARTVCVDIDGGGCQQTAALITQETGDALAVTADLTRWNDVQRSLDAAVGHLGQVDLLVANAGGSHGEMVPFLELNPHAWSRMIDRNLTTAFYCGLVYARHMADHGGGAIVYTSSQLSENVRPGMVHYATSKGGVRQLVKGMAVDLAGCGIRVNAIAPGPTMTPGTERMFTKPEIVEHHRRQIPLGRVAQPEEMVGACVYLASDEASFTTGATLFVDGGYTVI